MNPHMLGKVVRTPKPLPANSTLVRLDATVRPLMPGQLVGPRETPLATRPLADERLLARVPSQMGPQVRVLGVDAGTTGVRTREDLLLFGYCPTSTLPPASLGCRLRDNTRKRIYHAKTGVPLLELGGWCPRVVVLLDSCWIAGGVVVAVDGWWFRGVWWLLVGFVVWLVVLE